MANRIENEYGQLIEKWKVDIVRDRARLRRFGDEEINDAMQDVVPALLAFRYDPERSNGASERTAVTALVDRRLSFIQRGHARRIKRQERYAPLLEKDGCTSAAMPNIAGPAALRMDVQDAVSRLTPREQAVCAALARGETCSAIARELAVSRRHLNGMIRHIRGQFRNVGL